MLNPEAAKQSSSSQVKILTVLWGPVGIEALLMVHVQFFLSSYEAFSEAFHLKVNTFPDHPIVKPILMENNLELYRKYFLQQKTTRLFSINSCQI